MEIHVPDPHPGRCRNIRSEGVATARCIDYDGTEHVCSFPDLKPYAFAETASGIWSQSTVRTPVPWVKPGQRTEEGTE